MLNVNAGHSGVQKKGPPASKAIPTTRVVAATNGLQVFGLFSCRLS